MKCAPPLPVSNANLTDGGVDSLIGDQAMYSCDTGFMVNGTDTPTTQFIWDCLLAENQVEGYWPETSPFCVRKCVNKKCLILIKADWKIESIERHFRFCISP